MSKEFDGVEIEPSQIKDPDARYLAELDAKIIEKDREAKNRKYFVGEVAHTHDRELHDGRWVAQNCRAVEYQIKHREGLEINDQLYTGKVIVPQCTANQLNWMDQEVTANEIAIYTNKGRMNNDLGEIKNTYGG
jgi:hypothetical protein